MAGVSQSQAAYPTQQWQQGPPQQGPPQQGPPAAVAGPYQPQGPPPYTQQGHVKHGESHYRKTSSISRTKSQNLNASCIVLRLSSLNPLKPGVKLRTKM